MSDPAAVAAFASRRAEVLARIARAAEHAGRDPRSVTLVAVSKTVDAVRLVSAVEAGLSLLGENRVQEAAEKAGAVAGATWHLIGPLQSNKARRAVELFAAVETVDTVDLARRLDRLAGEIRTSPLPVYLQVNVDRDPRKSGFLAEDLRAALPEIAELSNLELVGLMTVGRLVGNAEEARPTFAALRELCAALREAGGGERLGAGLSMGMSDDFEVAIEEGATLVRVGRAIFGERPTR